MMTYSYITEVEGPDGLIRTREWGTSLNNARGYARRLSDRDHSTIAYVVAIAEGLHSAERVGAEGYSGGRLDTRDGSIEA